MNALADHCQVASREWAGVCSLLETGRQVVLVRKGGVAESAGPGVFTLQHSEFWLYPTYFHEADQGLRESANPAKSSNPEPGWVTISGLARVIELRWLDDESAFSALERFHGFTLETMRKRFSYRQPGLWLILARIYRTEQGVRVPVRPEHAGCKTWIQLEEPLSTAAVRPVLADDDWARTVAEFGQAIGARP